MSMHLFALKKGVSMATSGSLICCCTPLSISGTGRGLRTARCCAVQYKNSSRLMAASEVLFATGIYQLYIPNSRQNAMGPTQDHHTVDDAFTEDSCIRKLDSQGGKLASGIHQSVTLGYTIQPRRVSDGAKPGVLAEGPDQHDFTGSQRGNVTGRCPRAVS